MVPLPGWSPRSTVSPAAGPDENLSPVLPVGSFTPQMQVNVRAEKPESGPDSDAANSGATLVYLSPGFSMALARGLDCFAFVAVPVLQRVSGLQLQPRYLLSAGLHYRF